MARRLLKVLNFITDLVVILAFILAGAYSVYALWDNGRVYIAAENVQANILKMKPAADRDKTTKESFDSLREINPDICAWLTLDNTKIDYPILQGSDNIVYINTDVYGNFALAGSIFLDSRNDRSFGDGYSLLYGHHMENSKMFGDLDLYKKEEFFDKNSSGTLILPDRVCRIEIFACILMPASEKMFFDPGQMTGDSETRHAKIAEMVEYVSANAMYTRRDVTERILASDTTPQILAMSTCSSEFTDARTVVLAVTEPCFP